MVIVNGVVALEKWVSFSGKRYGKNVEEVIEITITVSNIDYLSIRISPIVIFMQRNSSFP